jgi:hypothetical protein
MEDGRSMRAVKDGLPTPSGESEESEDSRWTRAMGAYAVMVICSFKQAEQGNVLLQDFFCLPVMMSETLGPHVLL